MRSRPEPGRNAMSTHPFTLVDPLAHWIDDLIREHGLDLYMFCVWLSPLLIVWILKGGFWRRHQPRSLKTTAIIEAKIRRRILPPIFQGEPPRPSDDDSQSFAA